MKNTKPHKVVMLATKGTKKAMLASNLILGDTTQQLFFADTPSNYAWGHQHLYIISNEKIKKGDWALTPTNEIKRIEKIDIEILDTHDYLKIRYKKIISSTDKSITPDSWIPESFLIAYLKSYNEGNPIAEVDLEIEKVVLSTTSENDYDEIKIKIRPDGSVIIHQSKMYSRKEVENKLLLFGLKIMEEVKNRTIGDFDQNKWIEENI